VIPVPDQTRASFDKQTKHTEHVLASCSSSGATCPGHLNDKNNQVMCMVYGIAPSNHGPFVSSLSPMF